MIVDDHVLFREGMLSIIARWEDFTVVAEAKNGIEAVRAARELHPDVILMDITMPQFNGIEATKVITQDLPEIKIVMLTISEEEDDLFEAIKAGASGYVLKDMPSKRLHDQLRKVLDGESPLSGIMAAKILKEYSHTRDKAEVPPAKEMKLLTEREQQVLELVTAGLTNPEIAEKLFLSENTVKKYIHKILAKLQVKNRVEAATYVLRNNLGQVST